MPKISIIIPIYNTAHYLQECLDSVINQTIDDIEIICVNDGSTDNSLEILKAYEQKDNRIKVISKQNTGYGHTMNVGIDTASGEYIGIVESDDYVAPDMYATLYDLAVMNNLDFVKTDFYQFRQEKNKFKSVYRQIPTTDHYYNCVLDPGSDLEIFKFVMKTWNGIYRKDFLQKHNIRHNETPGASYQDNGFWFQTNCWATRTWYLDQALYFYRGDNPNSSINDKGKVFCIPEEYRFIKGFLDSNSQLKNKFLSIYSFLKFRHYLFTFDRIAEEYKRMFLKHFSEEFNSAIQNGELDESLFTPDEWQKLFGIIKDPEAFYFEGIINNFRSQLDSVLNSSSYRVGRMITFIPRKLRGILERRKS